MGLEGKEEESCDHRWDSVRVYEVAIVSKRGVTERVDTREEVRCELCSEARDRLVKMDHLGKLVL
jgi:hypothetical protein